MYTTRTAVIYPPNYPCVMHMQQDYPPQEKYFIFFYPNSVSYHNSRDFGVPGQTQPLSTEPSIQPGKRLESNLDLANQSPTGKVQTSEKIRGQIFSCHCKKSKCLKQYCLCMKSGNACGDLCHCVRCKNKKDNKRKKPKQRQTVTCNCIESKCSKKYCQCFAVGSRCNDRCKCVNCKN